MATRMLALASVAAVVALAIGCREGGDGDGDVDADVDADGDGDTDADGDAGGDADADADGDAGPLTCPAAVTCVAACGADDDCAWACAERICEGGQEALVALVTCTANQCGGPCADRSSPGCGTCIDDRCELQVYACGTTSCVPGELSCAEATACMSGCGADRSCADGCEGRICSGSGPALSALLSCADSRCATQCADYGSDGCGDCLWASCRPESNGCLGSSCTL